MDALVEFHTSGSTGTPKVVRKSQASLDADAAALLRAFRPLFESRPAFVATIQRDHMFGRLWLNTLAPLARCEAPDPAIVLPEELADRCSRHESVLLVTTPSFLDTLLQTRERDDGGPVLPRNIVGVVTSGSLLTAELSARAEAAFGVCPTEIFGSTETGSVAWRRQKNGPRWTLFDEVDAEAEPETRRLSVRSPFCVGQPGAFTMSDAVEFVAPREFMLLGRTDRTVKILEQLVDLSAVESALAANPLVERAHAIASDEPVPHVWALVELSQEGRDTLRSSTYHAIIHSIAQSLRDNGAGNGRPAMAAAAIPRRIRFVRALPFNAQGKLSRTDVLPILKSPLQEPLTENYSVAQDSVAADLLFPPDHICFQGHFPGRPVLPGVAQLCFVERLVRGAFALPPFRGTVRRLKFRSNVLPGAALRFSARRPSPDCVDFSIESAAGPCLSGAFEFSREAVP